MRFVIGASFLLQVVKNAQKFRAEWIIFIQIKVRLIEIHLYITKETIPLYKRIN